MKNLILKSKKITVLFAVLMIVMQSCVVTSIHPLYSDDTKTHLEKLNGTWIGDDEEIQVSSLQSMKLGNADLQVNVVFDSAVVVTDSLGNTIPVETYSENGVPLMNDYYKIVYISQSGFFGIDQAADTTVFKGVLLKLDDEYYMDLILDQDFLKDEIKNVNIRSSVLPVHLFCKLKLDGGDLKITFISEKKLKGFVKYDNVKLNMIKRDGRVVLAAETKELQKFVKKYSEKPFFNDPDSEKVLKRKSVISE